MSNSLAPDAEARRFVGPDLGQMYWGNRISRWAGTRRQNTVISTSMRRHRRRYDVILRLYACWVVGKELTFSFDLYEGPFSHIEDVKQLWFIESIHNLAAAADSTCCERSVEGMVCLVLIIYIGSSCQD